jgi:hypothetical protein
MLARLCYYKAWTNIALCNKLICHRSRNYKLSKSQNILKTKTYLSIHELQDATSKVPLVSWNGVKTKGSHSDTLQKYKFSHPFISELYKKAATLYT